MISKAALIILPLIYMFAVFMLSAWRTQRQIRKQSSELSDPVILRLNARLAKAAGITEVSTSIYEVATINGLVTANGDIYLTRGLYDCFQRGDVSAEELSSVTAHELGHLALGHTKKRLAVFASQNAIRMALGMVLGRFIPFFGGLIATGLVKLLGSRISRVDELEADKFASALLFKAGIGTEPQKNMLRNLEKVAGRPAAGIAWLMSHPSIAVRIREIEKNERLWTNSKKSRIS